MNNFWKIVLVVIGAFVLIQIIPYGRSHTNPAVVQEPAWDSPQTRELAVRACYDCHSNESIWPWYSNIAPASWLVQRDVDEARQIINFSDINANRIEGDELLEVISESEMPPMQYTLIHKDAVLTPEEQSSLINGFRNTFGGE